VRRGSVEIHAYTPDELLGTLNPVERKNAPPKLYTVGNIDLFRQGPRVSVVGSRKVSEGGLRRTRKLAAALVEQHIVVVSGLAEGVDTAAHQTAIESGGKTVAVLGTPLDKTFPAKNRALQETIMREYLAVSQFPLGYPPGKNSFPMRNRTMALLTDATIIVEAGEKSGTVHQGWEALRLGRLLFLMESVVNDPTLSWPAKMIGYGAQVLARDNLQKMLEYLPELSASEEVAI
jgi:DNA processing protein